MNKNIVVASGKGGTGKTTIAVNLAWAVKDRVRLLDCDVEAPNAHLFIQPEILTRSDVMVPVPCINEQVCTHCGQCAAACRYNAMASLKDRVIVFPDLCHGCGACGIVCPSGAIEETSKQIGTVETGMRSTLEFVQGRSRVGNAVTPPVIRAVKEHVSRDRMNIIDAPPGTSCPFVTTLQHVDFCILVAEPTPFGLNDLELSVEVLRQMNVGFGVVINRSNLGTSAVREFCAQQGIDIFAEIPFSKEIASSCAQGKILIETVPEYRRIFCRLMDEMIERTSA